MDEFKNLAAAVTISVFIGFAAIGLFSVLASTPDYRVISNCKAHGYHNFNQVRIICRVEEPKNG